MSEIDPTSTGGADPAAGGGKKSDDPSTKKDDTVSYESHKKLLDEKKNLAKRLEEFEKKAKDEKDAELKAKEQFKELYEATKKEAEELATKLKDNEREKNDYRKLNAFIKSVDGDVPQQYWGLIDLDKIALDDSGKVDEASVKKAVKDFEKSFPEVVKKKTAKMPNDAAAGGTGTLSHEQWAKLPYDEKRKRLKDVKDIEA